MTVLHYLVLGCQITIYKGIITRMLAALALSDILRWEIPFVCLELRRVCQQRDKFYSHSEIAS